MTTAPPTSCTGVIDSPSTTHAVADAATGSTIPSSPARAAPTRWMPTRNSR